MPLRKGEPVAEAAHELRGGKTFKRTAKKFGKKRARKQMIAIALRNRREGKRGRKHAARR
jgi:hypothetical protein